MPLIFNKQRHRRIVISKPHQLTLGILDVATVWTNLMTEDVTQVIRVQQQYSLWIHFAGRNGIICVWPLQSTFVKVIRGMIPLNAVTVWMWMKERDVMPMQRVNYIFVPLIHGVVIRNGTNNVLISHRIIVRRQRHPVPRQVLRSYSVCLFFKESSKF